MGIKRFLKIKSRTGILLEIKRKLKINNFELKFFENYSFNFEISKSTEVSIVIFSQIQSDKR
jgi:hypothetical protein